MCIFVPHRRERLNLFLANNEGTYEPTYHRSRIVSSKIYDERGDFNLEIVNFPFLDGYVSRSSSYGVYISQLYYSFCKSVF